MNIRRLNRDEWDKLKPIFASFNELPPDASNSAVIIAEEAGEIIGMLPLQLIIHAEPLWIKEEHRGRYIIPQLLSKINDLFPGLEYCFTHATDPKMCKFLERIGLKQMSWKPFRWLRKEQI